MRYLLSVVALIAALLCILASAGANYAYMSSLGRTPLEGAVFGWVSVGFDLLKSVLPGLVQLAWTNGRLVYVAIGAVLFPLLLAFAMISAFGYAAEQLGYRAGSHEATVAEYAAKSAELARRQEELARLGSLRGTAAVEADIATLRHDRLFDRSRQCAEATAEDSRRLCQRYEALKGELAAALEERRIADAMAGLERDLAVLRRAGALGPGDAQAGLIGRWLGLAAGDVRDRLILFFGVMLELMAGFGLFLALGHGAIVPGRRAAEPASPAPAPSRRRLKVRSGSGGR